jgi:hypothetical protein
VKGRKGEGAKERSVPRSRVLEQPDFGVVLHLHQLANDVIIAVVEFAPRFGSEVTAADRILHPRLGLGRLAFRTVKFVAECGLIPSSPPASEMWLDTEREDRRIWSVSEYNSSRGKVFESSNKRIAASTESL